MKKMVFFLFAVFLNMAVFAGGIEERDGQAYAVGLFSTMYVQTFVTEGKFQIGNERLGPGDSEDGTFRNNILYWAGWAQIKTSGIVRRNSAIQFRAGEGEEYIWLNAQYIGPQVSVSNTAGYIFWGTLSFVNNRAVIQIKYIDPYDD